MERPVALIVTDAPECVEIFAAPPRYAVLADRDQVP